MQTHSDIGLMNARQHVTKSANHLQSIGRFIALFLVVTPHEQLQKSVLVVVLFLAWSLIENVR